jgi:hypothetical protein
MEVEMVIGCYKRQGNECVKEIKVEGEREKEKEVIVRHEIVSLKWKKWNYDNFSHDWNRKYSIPSFPLQEAGFLTG